MNEQLVQVLGDLAVALSPLLIAALGWLAKKVADKIKVDVDNKLLRSVMLKVDGAALLVVKELSQVYASEFKKASADGKLSKKEKDDLKALGLHKLKSYLSLDEVMRVLGLSDSKILDDFLSSKIEAAVSDVKVDEVLFAPKSPDA